MTSDSKINKRKIVIIVAGLGLSFGAGWLAFTLSEADSPSAAHSHPSWNDKVERSVATRSTSNATPGPCSFEPGTRMAYDVTTETQAELDLSPLLDDIQMGGGSVTAEATPAQMRKASRSWHLDLEAVARTTDGSSMLAARIVDHGIHVVDGASAQANDALQTPFVVRVDPRCSIREYGWSNDGDLAVAREQQAMTAALNFWAPPESSVRNYGEIAFDSTGRYQAAYQVDLAGDLVGRALEFHDPFTTTEGPEPPTLEVIGSTIKVGAADNAWFGSLFNKRALAMSVRDEQIGTQRSEVTAKRVDPGDWRPEVDVEDDRWVWGLLLDRPLPREKSAPAVDDAIAKLTLEQAVTRL